MACQHHTPSPAFRLLHRLVSHKNIGAERSRSAQTVVLLAVSLTAIFLLCGLAIDSGLYYLAKARLSRAIDGGALAALATLTITGESYTQMATTVSSFVQANYSDINSPNDPLQAVTSNPTTSPWVEGKLTGTTYQFNYHGNLQYDPGDYQRQIGVAIHVGASGQVISITVTSSAPAPDLFMKGFGGFNQLRISGSATVSHSPNLVMIVIDRSGSMLYPNGGAYGLPEGISQFLQNFVVGSDKIGLVSFSSNARVEFAPTTNFIVQASSVLANTTNSTYQADQNDNPFGLKFGGNTAADEGMRLGVETMMTNVAFTDPAVTKTLVFFTDGSFNTVRSLFAAPAYTNVMIFPNTSGSTTTNRYAESTLAAFTPFMSNPNYNGYNTVNGLAPTNGAYVAMTNYTASPSDAKPAHSTDIWQSVSSYTDLGSESAWLGLPTNNGAPLQAWEFAIDYQTNSAATCDFNSYPSTNAIPATPPNGFPGVSNTVYTEHPAIWLPPGSVDYAYSKATNAVFVSGLTNSVCESARFGLNQNAMTNNESQMYQNYYYTYHYMPNDSGSNVLVMPGYLVDGCICSDQNLTETAVANYATSGWQSQNFAIDNYEWPDSPGNPQQSMERNMAFSNYPALLTGHVVYAPYGPSAAASTNGLYPVGEFYPSAPVLWLFNDVAFGPSTNFILSSTQTSAHDGGNTTYSSTRHIAYTTNMLEEDPQWCGELFYEGPTNGPPGNSTQITSVGGWTNAMPDWMVHTYSSQSGIMTSVSDYYTSRGTPDPVHGLAYYPSTYRGHAMAPNETVSEQDPMNYTGGYVVVGGVTNSNAMCWNGRPTHYFDFITGQWLPIPNNNTWGSKYYVPTTMTNNPATIASDFITQMCTWKVSEYCAHVRAQQVKIYTIGFGGAVTPAEQYFLAVMANSGTATQYTYDQYGNLLISNTVTVPNNTAQPVGQQFYVSGGNAAIDLKNSFLKIASQILGYISN